jgi:lipopolysaccharide export system permease protein
LRPVAEPPWKRHEGRRLTTANMTLLERYIFRIAATAFAVCLGALTAVIWLSSALKEMDLVSGKGQTILVFLKVTLLTLPALIMIIAPVALFAAVLYALNKLNGDSELIVMNAAGMSPLRVARPLGILTIFVAFMVGYITIFAMPSSFRDLRDMLTKIRADVVTKFLQEGRFTTLDKGITFHYREKTPSGAMLGIFIHDGRDAARQTTYLAERGQIVETGGGAFMVLEQGSVHRLAGPEKPAANASARPSLDAARQGDAETAIVAFSRYSIDLDQFTPDMDKVVYKPRERRTSELLNVDPNELYAKLQAGRFRAELHERFAAPIYALTSMMIAFAALGGAKTTRQGRGAAVAGAVIAMIAVRIAGFGANSLAVRSSSFTALIYAVPIGASVVAGALAWRTMLGAAHTPAWAKTAGLLAENALDATRARIPARFRPAAS